MARYYRAIVPVKAIRVCFDNHSRNIWLTDMVVRQTLRQANKDLEDMKYLSRNVMEM